MHSINIYITLQQRQLNILIKTFHHFLYVRERERERERERDFK